MVGVTTRLSPSRTFVNLMVLLITSEASTWLSLVEYQSTVTLNLDMGLNMFLYSCIDNTNT